MKFKNEDGDILDIPIKDKEAIQEAENQGYTPENKIGGFESFTGGFGKGILPFHSYIAPGLASILGDETMPHTREKFGELQDERRTQNPKLFKTGEIIGEVAPILASLGSGLGLKVAGKFAPNILKNVAPKIISKTPKAVTKLVPSVLKNMLKSGAYSGLYGAGESKTVEDMPEDFVKSFGTGALFGGLTELGGKAISKGIGKLSGLRSKLSGVTAKSQIKDVMPTTQSKKLNQKLLDIFEESGKKKVTAEGRDEILQGLFDKADDVLNKSDFKPDVNSILDETIKGISEMTLEAQNKSQSVNNILNVLGNIEKKPELRTLYNARKEIDDILYKGRQFKDITSIEDTILQKFRRSLDKELKKYAPMKEIIEKENILIRSKDPLVKRSETKMKIPILKQDLPFTQENLESTLQGLLPNENPQLPKNLKNLIKYPTLRELIRTPESEQ